jgi:tartrate-resistant acid phosphatase type 5
MISKPPSQEKLSGVSKRRKRTHPRALHWLQKRRLLLNRSVKKILSPVYRRLGITSAVRWFVPSYRQVSISRGGQFFQGAFLDTGSPRQVIAVIGDYGSGKKESHLVAEMVREWPANAVVTLGDNVYFETGFQTLVGNLYGDYLQSGSFFPAAGNHDYSEGFGIIHFDRFFNFLRGNRWYSVTFGDVDFFVLDSHQALHHPEVLERQRDWLESSVLGSRAKWKIVIVHHPPHSARARSQEEFRFPYAEWGVCMVMSGHDHTLQHLVFDGVHYVVNGIGGGSLHQFEEILEGTVFRLSTHYGAVFLDLSEDTMIVRFVTLPNTEVHTFEILASAPPQI